MEASPFDGESVTLEVAEGAELVMNEETGEVEVIDLGDPNMSQEIEVVTVDSGLYANQRRPSATTISVSQNPLHRTVKSAPALLRNSRRVQPPDTTPGGITLASGVTHGGRASNLPPASANFLSHSKSGRQAPSTSQHVSSAFGSNTLSSGFGFSPSTQSLAPGLQHAVVLDENGQETHEYVILAPDETGEYSIVDRGTREGHEEPMEYFHTEVEPKVENSVSFQHQGQTIIICQDPDSNQVSHMVDDGDGNLVALDGYQLDSNTIFSMEDGNFSGFDQSGHGPIIMTPMKVTKPKKKSKKPLQVMIGSDGKPLKKKGQTELKCMEKACIMTCFNVSELRKHLHLSHSMQFDEEVIMFTDENEFKQWRENYERDRMVSFIYRGGTKKIAKDQAVTYMICHRSGHYKPTMVDESKRKRKMKPQGSCKMGGYCTAGIKLLKNLDSGNIRMDICHTHYGHPLDSDAIPHLRVNPTLRKIILGKFQEGLSFTEVLAYIHHNPDRLEGLRLVDRRAVRNIFDTWKNPTRRSKKAQKDFEEVLNESGFRADNESSSIVTIEGLMEEEQSVILPSNSDILVQESGTDDPPLLHKATERSEAAAGEEKDEDLGPPTLIPVNQPTKKKKTSRLDQTKENENEKSDDSSNTEEDDDDEDPLLAVIKTEPGVPIEESVNRGNYRLRPNRKVEVYKPKHSSKYKKSQSTSDGEQGEEGTAIAPKLKDRGKPKKTDLKKVKVEVRQEEELPEHTLISESLEKAIDKLQKHGESGPTVLLYKPLGQFSAKYGEAKRDLRKDDFCVVLQSPVQRQLMQMFPNVIGFEVLDGPKSSQSQLKLAFLIVLDEYREAIPVAWLVANSVTPRIIVNFFKSIRGECGELRSKYFMAPRNSDGYRLWCSTFADKPFCLQNDIEVRRDLKVLVNNQFNNEKARKEVWDLVETLLTERNKDQFMKHQEQLEPESLPNHDGPFLRKFKREWISKAEEWALCYRIGTSVNLMGVSQSFGRLKKFVSFKGTKNLYESFEHILKIGYDKCFLRSKRMFKGDQKFSQYLEEIKSRHIKSREIQDATIEQVDDDTALIRVAENKTYEVFSVGTSCDCKLVCKFCSICVHNYLCTCNDFATSQVMCEHIHMAHCHLRGIADEPELITGDLNENESVFGKIETDGTEENPGAVINLGAVLKAAGLFHRSDGLQPDQIVSITDADTQRVLYEQAPSTIQVDSNPDIFGIEGSSAPESFANPGNLTETEIAVQNLTDNITGEQTHVVPSDEFAPTTPVVVIADPSAQEEGPIEIHLGVDDIADKETLEISTKDPTSFPVSDIVDTTSKSNDDSPETEDIEMLKAEGAPEDPEEIETIANDSAVQSPPAPKSVKKVASKSDIDTVRRSNRMQKVDTEITALTKKRSVSNLKEDKKQPPPAKRKRPDVVDVNVRRTSLRRKK